MATFKKRPQAKKTAVKSTARKRSSAASATLQARTAQQNGMARDAVITAILAIGSVTPSVTIDTSANPVVVHPPNLLDLKFNDPSIKMTDEQVATLKESLTLAFPQIDDEIALIEDSADCEIGDVVEFIDLAVEREAAK